MFLIKKTKAKSGKEEEKAGKGRRKGRARKKRVII